MVFIIDADIVIYHLIGKLSLLQPAVKRFCIFGFWRVALPAGDDVQRHRGNGNILVGLALRFLPIHIKNMLQRSPLQSHRVPTAILFKQHLSASQQAADFRYLKSWFFRIGILIFSAYSQAGSGPV